MGAQARDHAWLNSQAARTTSDVLLGCVLAIAGSVAIANVQGRPFAQLDHMSPWGLPAAVGYALATISGILILRGCFYRSGEPERWNVAAVLAIVPGVAVAAMVASDWSGYFALMLGPSDFVALLALQLAISIAIVRGSLLRTIGMALLGLLLGTIGTEISSGSDRLTFGMDQLADGFALPILVFGLIVAADGLTGLISPSLLVATYTRQMAGLANPPTLMSVAFGVRILAVIALAASAYGAYLLNNSMFDVCLLLAVAVFGVACKVLDWSRLVLLLAFALEQPLEENIRRALLISRGDVTTFVRWPLSAAILLLAGVVLSAVALLPTLRALPPRLGQGRFSRNAAL
jgi:TctA family transporter